METFSLPLRYTEGMRRSYAANHRLREIVLGQGRKWEYVARAAGISRPHLSNIVAGRRAVPEGLYARLAAILGVSKDSITIL